MTRRMWMATIALFGIFVAIYLTLFKLGVIGTLACTASGSCETVQLSRWAVFLGVPVAAWGIGYYAAIFALSFAGTLVRWSQSRTISLALLFITGWGVVFSAYLTWLELFVIHAICWWCVGSAIFTVVLFLFAIADFYGTPRTETAAA